MQNAACVTNDTHSSPALHPRPPSGREGKIQHIPEFLHDAHLNAGLRKEQRIRSEDRANTTLLCSWRTRSPAASRAAGERGREQGHTTRSGEEVSHRCCWSRNPVAPPSSQICPSNKDFKVLSTNSSSTWVESWFRCVPSVSSVRK